MGVWKSTVSSPSGVRGRAPADNEFNALYYEKATGGNDFEYSECMFYREYRDGVGPSPKGGRISRLGPLLNPPLASEKDFSQT